MISNREIAELLAREGEKAEGYRRKALFGAAHEAFRWPVEAAQLKTEGESLTALRKVGPFIARAIDGWLENPPAALPVPPPERRNFLTMALASKLIADHPDWRRRLRGDLQMHTNWSDGSGTVHEMAEAGRARGYEYIGVTDHTKGLKIAGGIGEEQLERQAEEIRALHEGLPGMRVLRSVEMNLSPSGEGDLDPAFLGQMDYVLGSFHSKLRVKEDQTVRYLAALDNRSVHILGHPRGRIYNYRLGLSADWPRVFARAAKLDKAVEIDGYSDRQDLDVELLGIARAEGARISFGSDAHHPWQLAFLDLSLAAAILAGIPPDRIINFMTADELTRWARER